jgi:3-oxoacyl-[acyl-carrier-protein] synthase II
VVLLSTIMVSRPEFDLHPDGNEAAEHIGMAFSADIETVREITGHAADVIGIGSGCAAGTSAVGIGAALIESGRTDLVVCVGAELLSYEVITLFGALGGLAGDGYVRPFDAHRRGMLPGEGWGVLVLESERRARQPLARICGYGEACDGFDLVRPCPDGTGLRAAIEQALLDSGCGPDDIAWICAHGTGTKASDGLEARIYDSIFAARRAPLPCVSVKGVTGHTQGAAGVIEAAVAVKSLSKRAVPLNPGLREVDPAVAGLRRIIVPDSTAPLEDGLAVLSISFGFGGSASAVLIGPP